MTKRYFKFTDGTRTVFRGTGMAHGFRFGWTTPRGWVGFSNSAVNAKAVTYFAVEIDKAEFNALVKLKAKRVADAGLDNDRYSSPQDAWVFNEALAQA
jgi:hypothetical protein